MRFTQRKALSAALVAGLLVSSAAAHAHGDEDHAKMPGPVNSGVHLMETLNTLPLASSLALSALSSAHTADQAAAAAKRASAADRTEGEVKKIDKDNKKLTIKHGEIKNLEMPGMTMVFKVKDPAMIDKVKVGDKIRFVVENTAAGMLVTELVSADR